MQAIMDIICVWVLVVAALMVFCFLRCCQQGVTLLSKTNACYIFCQTPAYIAKHGLARCQKFILKKKSTTYDI